MRTAIEVRRSVASTRLPRVLALCWLLVTAPVLAGDSWHGIERDPSGLGLVLPGGVWVSGDLTLTASVPEGEPAVGELDDASLFARWEPTSRLALFGHLRLEDTVELVEGEGFITGGPQFLVERLYGEAFLTPDVAVRVGKVFTPYGLWNVISRTPLTWTVEEPAIIEDSFPRHATGLSLLYQKTWRGWSLDGTVYGPAQDEISFNSREDIGWLSGGRMAAGRDLGFAFAQLGINAAGFRPYDAPHWTTTSGVDLEVAVGGHEIASELIFRVPNGRGRNRYGLYVQDAIPLPVPHVDGLYGVLRFEWLQPPRGGSAIGQLVGLLYRPTPNLVFKVDYLYGTRRLESFEPGVQASIAVLF